MPVVVAADRERRKLTECHRLPGKRSPERLRQQRNDGGKRNRLAGYGRNLTTALRERNDPVHQEKRPRQAQHSVRWSWNRVVSGMLTAPVTLRGAVT